MKLRFIFHRNDNSAKCQYCYLDTYSSLTVDFVVRIPGLKDEPLAITLFVHGYTCWRFPCRRESRIFCEYQFIKIILYSLLNSLQFNNVLFIIDILCKPCKRNKEIDLYLDNKLTLWRIYSNTHILYTK